VTDFDAEFFRLVGDERTADAARARTRERNLRTSTLTDATLAGLFLDIAERGDTVALRTTFGRALRGHLSLVADDGIVLDGALGTSYLRFDGVATVRILAGRSVLEPSAERTPRRGAAIAALIAAAAVDRPRVAIAVTGEQGLLTGELRAVGSDVVTVAVQDGAVYVATRHVSELTVLASG